MGRVGIRLRRRLYPLQHTHHTSALALALVQAYHRLHSKSRLYGMDGYVMDMCGREERGTVWHRAHPRTTFRLLHLPL
jgi:hypothetical protein